MLLLQQSLCVRFLPLFPAATHRVFLVVHGNVAVLVELPHTLGSQHGRETQHLFAVSPTHTTAELETIT